MKSKLCLSLQTIFICDFHKINESNAPFEIAFMLELSYAVIQHVYLFKKKPIRVGRRE